MRLLRILSTVLAFALIGLLPMAGSSADAVQHHASAQAAHAKPKVGARIVKRHGKLLFIGQVRPPRGPVRILKATRCNRHTGVCNFKRYRTQKLHNGRYSVRVQAPGRGQLYWQARVGNARSSIWVTCKSFGGSCS